jgi:Glycosyltransferase family 17
VIVDCFTFFNELDILELRLTLLDGVVDRFVLCEAPFTFRGATKPLLYAQHAARFARWKDRIVHLVYDAEPSADPWQNEWGQRAFLTTAVRDLAVTDLVLIGDIDEIPAPEHAGQRPGTGRVLAHRQLMCVGYVNRVAGERWIGTKAIERGDLGTRTLEEIRALPFGSFDMIDSGWHFSTLGGPGAMAEKIRAYSHSEIDIPYLNDERRLAIRFESEAEARWIPLDAAFPRQLQEARWAAFVWPAPRYERSEAQQLMHAHGCFAGVPAGSAAAALVHAESAGWQRVGEERFGDNFAGAFGSVPELLAALPAGGWAVIGELGCWTPANLAALAAHGLNVVAYAQNARSYAVLKDVVAGEPFPAGPARGLPELAAMLDQARWRVERRDDVMDSLFAPSLFAQSEPFDAEAGAFYFTATTRGAMHHFSTKAYVFTLRPADV